jgi:hypothetical protein
MEGGPTAQTVDIRVDPGVAANAARYISRLATIAAFVAVIAVIFHVTGSLGPRATANQAVLVLAILIGQVNMPHRKLRGMLRAPSMATRPIALEASTQE